MKTRRDVLKAMSVLGLTAVADPRFSWTQTNRPSSAAHILPLKKTLIILNGTFAVLFGQPKLLVPAPSIDGHIYRIDNTPIPQSTMIDISIGNKPIGVQVITHYKFADSLFRPDKEGFPFNSSDGAFVTIKLPYPQQIYAHRMLQAVIETSAKFIPRDQMSGAIVLEYPPDHEPLVTGINYSPVDVGDYYRIVISSENPDPNMASEHTEVAWEALTSFFTDMNWKLRTSDYSRTVAASEPNSISDDEIEQLYTPDNIANFLENPKLLESMKDQKLRALVARAANCKAPLFVATKA